jgi:hypothetical protein
MTNNSQSWTAPFFFGAKSRFESKLSQLIQKYRDFDKLSYSLISIFVFLKMEFYVFLFYKCYFV